MTIIELEPFVGMWELTVDLPGAEQNVALPASVAGGSASNIGITARGVPWGAPHRGLD